MGDNMNKLCLGTVQFGMHYGINNKVGKPHKKDVFRMLDFAWDCGVRYLDTAEAYGDAEEIIGEFLNNNRHKKFNVVSKLLPNCLEEKDIDIEGEITKHIQRTLKLLGLDTLDGYLLHTPIYFYNAKIMDAMFKLKEKGYTHNIGISIYEVEHALDAASSGLCDYIQIPYSVFDSRVDKTDFFTIAKKNNVKVFARSAFLQGLILMRKDEIPDSLRQVDKYLEIFDDIIQQCNFSRVEAAFRFNHDNDNIDYIVFGTDNIKQLEQDIHFACSSNIFVECRKKIQQRLSSNIENSIIIPSLWEKNKRKVLESDENKRACTKR